jgi:hypothetical protein
LAASAAWSAPTITLQDFTAFAGDTATLVISVNDEVKGLAGCDLLIKAPGTVDYGPTTIVPIGIGEVENGPFWELSPVSQPAHTTGAFDGLFEIATAQPHGFDGPGILYRVSLPISSAIYTDTVYPIRFIQAQLFNDNGDLMTVNAQNATATILGGKMGDVNGDGLINVGDAILALRISVGLVASPTPRMLRFGDVAPTAADGTVGDGKVTPSDALVILRKALSIQDRSTTPTPPTA